MPPGLRRPRRKIAANRAERWTPPPLRRPGRRRPGKTPTGRWPGPSAVALGSKRQVFLVSLGGFDLHDRLVEEQPTLLRKVSEAVTAFHAAAVELGVADPVTTFTVSDFGCALASNGNGNGTDPGWGGHHFIVGGAVRGRAFYGVSPPVGMGQTDAAEDQWHIGQGRLIPSSSVDQYAATLARWLGFGESELAGILPNLRNFGAGAGAADHPTDLGFLA